MLRKFTMDIGRFKTGTHCDYPRNVWAKIGADLMRTNPERFKSVPKSKPMDALDIFSEAVEFNATHQAMTRGPHRDRPRLN